MADNRIVVSPALYRALGIDEEVDRRVAERCAPLVHVLSLIADEAPDGEPPGGGWAQHVARGALRAHREREGAAMAENAEPDAIIPRAEYERLTACREALEELVALQDTYRMTGWHAAWERARAALEGGE